jgi:Uma2 family endonuclease
MAVPAIPVAVDERDLYPLHEEDHALGEVAVHYGQNMYLVGSLKVAHPDWFVTSNFCVYWVPNDYQRYCTPDVIAVNSPLPLSLRVYLVFQDPPVNFVAEVGSRSSVATDTGPKVELYQNLVRAREYLYADPPRGIVRLWRMEATGVYVEQSPQPNGRMRSTELELEFGIDDAEFLRIYTLDGTMFLTHEEEAKVRQAAELTAATELRERQLAEAQAHAAEARAMEEARLRQAAEARAAEEARRREALEREIARLRARLDEPAE